LISNLLLRFSALQNTPKPIEAAQPPASTTPALSDDGSIKKKPRRNYKSTERNPKLHVLRVEDERIVECEMENKPKTITFKFDVNDVNPIEVAKDLVSKDLLSEAQSAAFIEMVK
jgi:WNK lysine deficient protein kinase